MRKQVEHINEGLKKIKGELKHHKNPDSPHDKFLTKMEASIHIHTHNYTTHAHLHTQRTDMYMCTPTYVTKVLKSLCQVKYYMFSFLQMRDYRKGLVLCLPLEAGNNYTLSLKKNQMKLINSALKMNV